MARLNVARSNLNAVNAAGVPVRSIDAEAQLKKLVMANMLWEDQFYMDGKSSADQIAELVAKLAKSNAHFVEHLAIAARSNYKLRHVPLLLARELARAGKLTANTLNSVIQRPDEMGEFLSIYWKDGKSPIANQVKKGMELALNKFNEYQLAKWDKNSSAIRIRDVLFLSHAKPKDAKQAEIFRKLAAQELDTPDTWETQLSAGADKAETFTRLMAEKKLGALAFLRNLRNMLEAGIDESVIREYSKNLDVSKVLPFRYMAAARIVPQLEGMLEAMMYRSLESHEKLPGKTRLLVDVSSSMYNAKVSAKSDLTRRDAALALAILCREICEEVEIYSFSGKVVRIADRRGFALADAIKNSQPCSGTRLGQCLQDSAKSKVDRVIVFTDEQSYDRPLAPSHYHANKGYVVNVAAYANGINHGSWLCIDGFSEAVLDYLVAVEKA